MACKSGIQDCCGSLRAAYAPKGVRKVYTVSITGRPSDPYSLQPQEISALQTYEYLTPVSQQ